MTREFVLDYERPARLGFGEAIYCAGKSAEQIDGILNDAASRGAALLLTRLDPAKRGELSTNHALDYDKVSATAYLGEPTPTASPSRIVVVTAGTSDVPVARETVRTLAFNGEAAELVSDVGVAGIHRLLNRIDEIRRMPVVIVAAGMDAALPSVIAGLVRGVVIAVPTSVGYGVAEGGRTALNAILASCAPGIVTVNIDNGYGAATAALRMLGAFA